QASAGQYSKCLTVSGKLFRDRDQQLGNPTGPKLKTTRHLVKRNSAPATTHSRQEITFCVQRDSTKIASGCATRSEQMLHTITKMLRSTRSQPVRLRSRPAE